MESFISPVVVVIAFIASEVVKRVGFIPKKLTPIVSIVAGAVALPLVAGDFAVINFIYGALNGLVACGGFDLVKGIIKKDSRATELLETAQNIAKGAQGEEPKEEEKKEN